MTGTPDQREPLPPARHQFDRKHMVPIVRVLIERGHLPIHRRPKYGFVGGRCALTHGLTDGDWAAVTARYIIPDSIVWRFGLIRDHDNEIQIHGADTILSGGKEIPIEEWIARQDWSDLPADVASAAPGRRTESPG